MANVTWYRKGKWMEKNVLVIEGHKLDGDKFVEVDNAVTMINPVDFDHFVCVEQTVKQIGDDLVSFKLGETTYISDIPLFNAINTLSSEIMIEAADVICDEFDIDEEDLEDQTVLQFPRLALV
jgi:hypothetical protein